MGRVVPDHVQNGIEGSRGTRIARGGRSSNWLWLRLGTPLLDECVPLRAVQAQQQSITGAVDKLTKGAVDDLIDGA